jgi:hypothetical protein
MTIRWRSPGSLAEIPVDSPAAAKQLPPHLTRRAICRHDSAFGAVGCGGAVKQRAIHWHLP